MRHSHAAILLLALVGLLVSACSSGSSAPAATVTKTESAAPTSSSASTSAAAATPTEKPATMVHMTSLNTDGSTYGVGMPVIVYLSKKITDAKAMQDATKVTVNGKPAKGAWYFEYSSAKKKYPIEGHFRLQDYWPAHSRVHVDFPPAGTPVGKGYELDGKLSSLDFTTGARNIITVDDASNTVTLMSDGKKKFSGPTSLGAT